MNDPTNVKLRLSNSELWGGLVGLALGGFVIWSGLKLKLGTINDPGSGYVLFYTGILMCVFASAIIVATKAKRLPNRSFVMSSVSVLRLEQGPLPHRGR